VIFAYQILYRAISLKLAIVTVLEYKKQLLFALLTTILLTEVKNG